MSNLPSRLTAALSDRYRIERELGAGGMATVYLAHDVRHDRPVALKVLRPELAAVMGADRFLAEVRTTANLQHPHILPLFDSGEADSFLYYVMPYVQGESLRERLDRDKQLPIPEAVSIARAVAGALDYAHRQGVIHRDIKPANILLQDGQPVVADFGIALAVSAAGGGRLTETGLSLGTPYYMSPEQATADRDPGPASDVYSLACVLYEMIAGDPPHTGSTAQAVLARILTDRPRPLTDFRETVPANVAAAVARALAKVPADRFENAAAFAAALEDAGFMYTPAADTGPRSAAAAGTSGWVSRVLPWAVAAVSVVVAAWGLRRSPPGATSPAFRVDLSEFTVENANAGGWRVAISRDGGTIVVGGPHQLLYVRRADDEEFRPIQGTEGGRNPTISPDGQWVAFTEEGDLKRVLIAGGPVLSVVDQGGSAHWYAQDSILYSLQGAAYVVGVAGGVPREVATADGTVGRPFMLPGGKGLLFEAGGALGSRNIYFKNLESGEERQLISGASQPRYLHTRHILYGDRKSQTVFAVPFDPDRGVVTGTPVPVLPEVQIFGGGAVQAAVSDNGTLVDLRGTSGDGQGERHLAWADGEGRLTALPVAAPDAADPRVSPDGRRILYRDSDEGLRAFFVYDPTTGERTRIAGHLPTGERPLIGVWSADGTRIFVSYPDSGYTTYSIDPSVGEASEVKVASLPGPVTSVSPDGVWFVAEDWKRMERARDLVVGRLGQEPWQPRPYLRADWSESSGMISPDGHWMAYVSDESGRDLVYVRAFPEAGPAVRISPDSVAAHDPVWSHDGSQIYFLAGGLPGPRMMKVEIRSRSPFAVGPAKLAFPLANVSRRSTGRPYDIRPDGDRFLVVVGGSVASGDSAGLGHPTVVVNWFTELRARMGEGG